MKIAIDAIRIDSGSYKKVLAKAKKQELKFLSEKFNKLFTTLAAYIPQEKIIEDGATIKNFKNAL